VGPAGGGGEHRGRGATAGLSEVAKSPTDGHTLLITTRAQAYGAALAQDLPYHPLRDFVAIVPLTRKTSALVSSNATGITSAGERVAAAKAKPSELRLGFMGLGTGNHAGVEKFN
jgi:tripartite-type tricarboxylate transporter receptor subunit TctC